MKQKFMKKKRNGMTGLANRNCDNLSDLTFMNALVHNFNVPV